MTRKLSVAGILRNQTFILFLTLVAFVIIVSTLSPHFLTVSNLLNVLQQIAVVGIITVGMTSVILSGGLDISVGTVISLSASVTAVMIGNGANVALAVVAGFAVAVFGQFLNNRSHHLTRPAPWRPKIDQDRQFGLDDFLIKILIGKFHCHKFILMN